MFSKVLDGDFSVQPTSTKLLDMTVYLFQAIGMSIKYPREEVPLGSYTHGIADPHSRYSFQYLHTYAKKKKKTMYRYR